MRQLLLDELRTLVDEHVEQRNPNEMLDYFNIKKDITWEEEQGLLARHQWIDPEGLIAAIREKGLSEMAKRQY